MNSLYIGIGTALILALVTALIGPFFVDWGAHRLAFEAEASRIVGMPVKVLGDVDARLLPSPRIRFGDVVVGDLEHPVARMARFELDVEVAPLIKGDIRVGELRLERPEVELTVGADGRVAGLGATTSVGTAAVERVEIVDGRLTLGDGRTGQAIVFDHVSALGAAASLEGPWKLDGRATRESVGFGFHLSAGRNADDDWSFRIAATADDDPTTVTLDLRFASEGSLHAKGTIAAERRPADAAAGAAWRANAGLDVGLDGVEVRDVVLALGPEVREVRLTGSGRLRFGRTPEVEVVLSGRQIDLDRLTAGADERGSDPAAVIGALLTGVGAVRDRLPTGRMTLDVQNATLGGGLIQDVALEARTQGGEVLLDRLAARAPGRTNVSVSGRLGRAETIGFTGHGEIASDQPEDLAAWWSGRPAGDARFDAVSLSGDVRLGRDEMRGDGMRLTLGKAETRGWFDWTPVRGTRLGLTAERLELDQIGRLGRLFGVGGLAGAVVGAGALEIDLDARAVVLPGAVAKDVGLGARVSRDRVALSRLVVGDLAGAKLTGSGTINDPLGAPRGGIDIAVSAPRPAVAMRAVAGLVGGPEAADTAGRLGVAMGPLEVTARLSGNNGAAGASDLALHVDGRAAGWPGALDGRFSGRLDDWRAGRITFDGALFGDGAMRPATARVSIAGTAGEGLTTSLAASGALGRGSLEGRVSVAASGMAKIEQKVALTLADASGLAALAGRPIAAFEQRVPVSLSASVAGDWPKLTFSALTGKIGATALDGEGTIDLGRRPAALGGRVHLDRIAATTVADVLIGGGASGGLVEETGVWASAALEPPGLADLATADLAVSVDRLDLGEESGEGRGLGRVGGRVVFSLDETRIEGFSAEVDGGRLTGEGRVTRSAGAATRMSGRLALSGAGLDGLGWTMGSSPALTGRIGGELAFDTSGRSAAGLVSGLSGTGRLVVDEGRMAGLTPGAFAVVARVMNAAATPDEAVVAKGFAAAAAVGDWMFGRIEVPLALEAGVLRAGRTVIEAAGARLIGRGALDLGRETLEGEGTFEPVGPDAAALETAVTHSRPSVGVAVSGPITAPNPHFDTRILAAHLALGRVEAEIAHSEAQQREIEKARAERAKPVQ